MPRRKIYIETTIPSFYFEVRREPDMVARRQWTRRWWEQARQTDELVTSPAVIEELRRGAYEARTECLELIQGLPLLAIDSSIDEIVRTYVRHMVMPRDPAGDALHLALASHYRCDFLATWNCRHLANAKKFDHIRRVNAFAGLYVPSLVTPLELLGVDADER